MAAAIDRAVLPRPEDRGTLEDLRDALDGALDAADRTVGPVAASSLEEFATGEHAALAWPAAEDEADRPLGRGVAQRLFAASAAGALCGAVLSSLPASAAPAAAAPAFGAAAAAFAVLMLPRAGWLLSVCALGAWLAWAGLPGVTVLLAAAALPTMLLLPSRGVLWSAPAGAPLLGVFGLGLAWPAFAGRAAGGLTRAALGALGLWWLVLAEAIAGPRLLLGEVPGTPAPHVWEGSAVHAVERRARAAALARRAADRAGLGGGVLGSPADRPGPSLRAGRRRRVRLGGGAGRRNRRGRRRVALAGPRAVGPRTRDRRGRRRRRVPSCPPQPRNNPSSMG